MDINRYKINIVCSLYDLNFNESELNSSKILRIGILSSISIL